MFYSVDQVTFNLAADDAKFHFRIVNGNTLVFEGDGKPILRLVLSSMQMVEVFKRLAENKPYYEAISNHIKPSLAGS